MSRDQLLTGHRSTYDSEAQLRELRTAHKGRMMATLSEAGGCPSSAVVPARAWPHPTGPRMSRYSVVLL